ncbi:MAG: 4Fe-4S dicluster domain-containing protein [Nitrospirota bacterium]
MIPAQFSPPVKQGEFISQISDKEENRVEVGVLFVGAGPASLAGAIRLSQLIATSPEIMEMLGDFPIAIVEKGKNHGNNLLAGAVVNPIAIKRLFPDLNLNELPFLFPVERDAFYFLTPQKAVSMPIPSGMRNTGNYSASISQLGAWLAKEAEANGVSIFTETPATKLLIEDGRIKGVRTGDKGLDREGKPLPNFQEGTDIIAKVTVLGEGSLSHLTRTALNYFDITRPNPQIYALGVKELWHVPKPLNRIIHTMGWPLKGNSKFKEFGGSFIYPMGDSVVSIGLVAGLEYRDASLSVHDLLQEMKGHHFIKEILRDGHRLEDGWGAKTIPEGGYYSLPLNLNPPGGLLIGDSAGFLNVASLKGIHYAMYSGIYAAEEIYSCLKAGREPGEKGALSGYQKAIRESFIWEDLYRTRNIRQAFSYGLIPGGAMAWLMTLTGGLFPGWRFRSRADNEQSLFRTRRKYPKADGKIVFDKLSSVFASGNISRDNQPVHIRIQTNVPEIIGEAWINMCPANVYEWQEDDKGNRTIKINSTNCVHCGAIGAKGGRLTPPEGGSGPAYKQM